MGITEFEKHMRYKNMYKMNDLYWGLGIEEETYFQFIKPIIVNGKFMKTCHNPERYSVRYFNTYKSDYKGALTKLFPNDLSNIQLPFFLNANVFRSMDIYGNHKTTYEKIPKSNPNFSGKTFFEELCDFVPSSCYKPKSFSQIFNESCIFDGDSIEIVSQKFYKTKIYSVINELIKSKKQLLNSINNFLYENKKGLIMYPTINPGFVVHYSNPKNMSMFNNGTYHINITLPTLLGKIKNGIPEIVDLKKFKDDHQKFIRLIQWLEPFIIAVYGTCDPLSKSSDKYSKSSQRCAVSRYIGIGTYDTNKMSVGKILTLPVDEIRGSDREFWWYKKYHEDSGYAPLKELGMDINYRKHYNHGVEIRFLDWFPECELRNLFEFFVHLADHSLNMFIPEANLSEVWHNFVVDMLRKGPEYIVPRYILEVYEPILGFSLPDGTIRKLFHFIRKKMRRIRGICSRLML